MLNVALFSPNQNPYSETFVQAHKTLLKDKVYYYYGTGIYTQLEGFPPLAGKYKRIWVRLIAWLNKKPLSYLKDKIIADSLKRRKIDVVLVEYGIHAFNLLTSIKRANLPLVVHFHGYDASVPQAIKKCNNYEDVFEYASKIIAVSTTMKDMLIDLGCPSQKIVYNPCGPRREFEDVIPLYTKKQFIGIGRFVDKKAPYYTILAFQKALKVHNDARLILAGDGVLLDACQNLVKHLQIEKSVVFPGVITSDQFKEYLSESVAFVQHSIRASNGDMEGTPVSIVEAGLAGLPVVATKHAGIADVIIHEETGLLCEEHDVDTMSLYMTRILDDNLLAREMGDNNRKRIKDNFSLEKHIGLLQEVMIKAVNR